MKSGSKKVERIATTVAVVVTALIYLLALLSDWRAHLLFVMDRIVGALELLGGLIGLAFGFALIAVILRVLIIGVLDFSSWISNRKRRTVVTTEEHDPDLRA